MEATRFLFVLKRNHGIMTHFASSQAINRYNLMYSFILLINQAQGAALYNYQRDREMQGRPWLASSFSTGEYKTTLGRGL
jgi:hypothetical protein